MLSGWASDVTGSGLELVNLVGKISSGFEVAVDALRVGVETWTMLTRLVYFRLGFVSLAVCSIGTGTGIGVWTGVPGDGGFEGDVALRLAVDSRRCRAGRTRLGGVVSAILRSSYERQ